MNVQFIIFNSIFLHERICFNGCWEFPVLPRIGEEISPLILINQPNFTYEYVWSNINNEGRKDFLDKLGKRNIDKEKFFKDWMADIINEDNLVTHISYNTIDGEGLTIMPHIAIG